MNESSHNNVPNIVIENVARSVWHLAWNTYRNQTIWILILVLPLLIIPILPPLLLIAYYAYLYHKAEKIFMEQFAAANNFTYEKTAPLDSLRGRLFKIGDARTIKHVISGTYASHPIRLFNYSYTQGSDKHRTTYAFTICEISFEKTVFPHIFLQSKTMWRYAMRDFWGEVRDVEVPMDEHARDAFRLFCTQGYEIEVFEIFQPHVLQFLKERGAHFSIEFAENRMHIYDDKMIRTKKELDAMHTVITELLAAIGPLLNRLHDDFAALHPYYKDK